MKSISKNTMIGSVNDLPFSVVEKYHKEIESLKKGKTMIVKCPKCKGKLVVSRSAYNGHLHMSCSDCKWYLVQ